MTAIELAGTIALALSTLGAGAAAPPADDFLNRMAAEHAGDQPVASEAATTAPEGEVQEEEVTYATVEGKPVRGYLSRPAGAQGPLPAIIVIHEWWGLNDNVRAMGRRLAAEGYAALAVDLYRGQAAEDRDGARALVQEVGDHPEVAEANLLGAYGYLTKTLDAPRVGVIGWCFGGGWSLRTALALPGEIDATVIYYGRLVTDPEELAPLGMPILGHFGSEDRGIPVETVREFEAALTKLGKEAEIHVYEGANHAFANPSGTRYDPEAAEKAWNRTVAFLAQHLQEGPAPQ